MDTEDTGQDGQEEEAGQGRAGDSWPLMTLEDLRNMPEPEWLIEGHLPGNGLAVLYGPPGVGKTFLALDIALSVASGHDFHGHKVSAGTVVYVAADSVESLHARCDGWLQHHGIKPDPKLLFTGEPVALDDVGQVGKFLVGMERVDDLRLVVIDTLAHCNGGDENSAMEMKRVVDGIKAIRDRLEATVLAVHHTSKKSLEMRGSSALLGAIDTAMMLKGDSACPELRCEKQRNLAKFPPVFLEQVPVQAETKKGPVGTLVLRPTGAHKGNPAGTPREASCRQVLKVLEDNAGAPMTRKELGKAVGVSQATIDRSLEALEREGKVTIDKTARAHTVALVPASITV